MIKVAICICTYRRPLMLKSCLDSIAKQDVPDAWDLSVILVDNDPQSELSNDLLKITASYPFHIRYHVESSRGIPFARNAACELALDSGADWIVFIDDDEVAEPGWLLAYDNARTKSKAKVLAGSVRYVSYDKSEEFVRIDGKKLSGQPGFLESAATNNVMFSTEILRPPFSLRFDILMALTGGSDTDFFLRYRQADGGIFGVPDSVVAELVSEQRSTVRWKLGRLYRSNSNRSYINVKLYGKGYAAKSVLRIFWRTIPGLLVSPFYILFAFFWGGSLVQRALKPWVRCLGAVAGYVGFQPKPYKTTDGE